MKFLESHFLTVIRNRELLAHIDEEYFVLVDIVDSLGYKLVRNGKLSELAV